MLQPWPDPSKEADGTPLQHGCSHRVPARLASQRARNVALRTPHDERALADIAAELTLRRTGRPRRTRATVYDAEQPSSFDTVADLHGATAQMTEFIGRRAVCQRRVSCATAAADARDTSGLGQSYLAAPLLGTDASDNIQPRESTLLSGDGSVLFCTAG